MSRAKAMGTFVETAIATWLRDNGFPNATRLPLAGNKDIGDLELCREPGRIIAECKRAHRGVQLRPWFRELSIEMLNARADTGLLIMKQVGVGDTRVGQWLTAMNYPIFWPLHEKYISDGGRCFIDAWPHQRLNQYIKSISEPPVAYQVFNPRTSKYPYARWARFASVTPLGVRKEDWERSIVFGPLQQFAAILRINGYGEPL